MHLSAAILVGGGGGGDSVESLGICRMTFTNPPTQEKYFSRKATTVPSPRRYTGGQFH